ncbi:MAG TPA: hypothetical protein DCS67_01515 [Clostridiales bacterium UBA8960]|jgi:hypothetical protein|nr:hypothetical protein [Clostridiales bacterium UBA8960]
MGKQKKPQKYYQEAYRFDPDENGYIIDVSLDSYDDVYDEWDPSPFKKRDIEDEFDDFVRDSSSDIPLKYGLIIELYLPVEANNPVKEKMLREAYDNFYRFQFRRAKKLQQEIIRKVVNNLVLSMLFLFLGYFSYPQGENIVLLIMKEGIFIGGWVFLWEVFTLLFVTLKEHNKEIKMIDRLIHAILRFIYK